jgi:DNA polymerase-3 subunit delta'
MYDFDLILGNEKIIKSLRLAILHNRVNHAYIFDGVEGIGKRTMANAFAKALNCIGEGKRPCGECVSCLELESGNHPDVIYVRRKKDKKEIGVDVIRDSINAQVAIKPYSSPYKIFIIEEADRMNEAAQNAFLKTLEEPPSYTVFLLLVQNYNALLTTILSRCQRFKLEGVSTDKIKRYLADRLSITEGAAQLAALYSQGSIGKATELAASEEFGMLRDEVISNAISLLEGDLINMYRLSADMDKHKENISSYLNILYLLYRDCLVYMQTGDISRLIQADKLDDIKKMCTLRNLKQLIRGCELIDTAMYNLSGRGDFALVIDNLFFKLKER